MYRGTKKACRRQSAGFRARGGTHKKRKPHGLRFSLSFGQSLELHTHIRENMGPVRKRRIRFLTGAKIGVFLFTRVVEFVVFAVVLRVVGACMALFEKLWNRIVSVSAPWMAAQNPAHCKVKSLEQAVLSEGLKSILRACRGESACRRLERGDAYLIEPYQEHERRYGDLLKIRSELAHFLLILRSGGLPSR